MLVNALLEIKKPLVDEVGEVLMVEISRLLSRPETVAVLAKMITKIIATAIDFETLPLEDMAFKPKMQFSQRRIKYFSSLNNGLT
jgi:hypothetical protein